MREPAGKKAKIEDLEAPDVISNLPDDILLVILSLLPLDEAVRSSILSKRWSSLWKYTSHLDLDVKHMIKPFSQLGISSSPADQLNYIINLPKPQGIYRYNILVYLLLRRHLGDLESCRLINFPQKEVKTCLDFVLEKKKGIQNLTLECRPLRGEKNQRFVGVSAAGIFSSLSSLEFVNYFLECAIPFEGCQKLRTLKLKNVGVKADVLSGILKNCVFLESFSLVGSKVKKIKICHSSLKFLELRTVCVNDEIDVSAERIEVLVLASVVCPATRLVLNVPRLGEFDSHCNPISQKIFIVRKGKSVLRTHEILENCSDLSEPRRNNIFKYLSSLKIDLDLNNKREAQALSFVLSSCVNLHTLEITTPVYKGSKLKSSTNNDGDLSYPNPMMLWERSEVCNCVHHKLKFVNIVGFTGKEQEAEFVKHLLTKATKLERITIVCKSSRKEAACLVPLQDQRASTNLSIMVKTAKKSPLVQLAELHKKVPRKEVIN